MLGKSTERDHWKEKFWEFEHEWLSEGGTYFYKVRAIYFDAGSSRNESGEPEVFFMVGVNTDFEYGRDSISWLPYMGGKAQQTEWCWECTAKAADITEDFIDALKREALDALRSA